MKIISWNVNGIRSALSKNFREFAAAENPDIVCVQETKIDPAAAEKLDLPFKYRYFHCAERAGYSGVAIFSNVEPLSVSREALCGSPDEGRFLSADFGKFVLTSIYAPNSQDALKRIDYKHAWNTAFAAKMAESRRNIVCGDFNVAHCEIDIARPRENEGNAGFSQTERDDFGMILKTETSATSGASATPKKSSTLGGATAAGRGAETWGGGSTIFSFRRRFCPKSKTPKFSPTFWGLTTPRFR